MKATRKFLSAASAAALSAGMIVSGSFAFQMATVAVAEAAVVRSVDIRGNRRVDNETIRSYLNVRQGQNYSGADIDEAVKRLFGTGLFADVRINFRGSTLVVEVDEYAIVNQVIFQGNRKLKDADLARAVQLRARGSFSNAAMEADVDTIRQAYAQIGREDALVSARTIDLGENRVNVVYEITEGGRTKIAAVNFVGNNAYSDRRLRDVISTKKSNILSFLFRDDVYDENRLRADEEALRRFYYNRGYADFRVISASAELDETSNEYTVNVTIEEGDRYTFGDVSIETTLDGIDTGAFDSLLETRRGNVYSAKDVEDTIIALTERAVGMGYAFTQVTPRGNRDFETRTISVVYSIDQGPRTYVERIEIRGNDRTRDYVIRREFDISEGDAFNQVLVQRAKRRLERLDYFTAVNISTVPGSQPDQVYLVIDVVEKSTGEFSVGAGYSTGDSARGREGVNIEGSISEKNFLGRGQFIKVSVGGGNGSRDYGLSFTEPYFLGRRISAGFDIFRQTRSFDNYTSELTGATVRFGLPITEALTGQVAYSYSVEEYGLTGACDSITNGTGVAPPDGIPDPGCVISPAIVTAVGQSPWVKSAVSGTLLYNTIDDMKNPREGIYSTFSVEVAGLGGDAQYVKLTGRGTYYHTLLDEQDVVGVLVAGAGHIIPTGQTLRLFDHFQNSDRIIRGFEGSGIGPASLTSPTDHLGGTTYFHASAEAQFPLPLVPYGFGLKGALFVDAATLYGNTLLDADPSTTGMKWRASVGASILWSSPFGPIRLDYAFPIVKEPTDEVQNINFGVSTRF
ncbi:outer membrane protein assembly factor BamA [Nitratireductor sp. CAU 1489]|uniref:Outer membrane protein assembly factor BamA n=1 Tax=Nitratireductor arenosus TaxID=2682096 RepID=A0A844QIK7_9HYPH|nr:outer membrane protein assembly factor BamA [Nitratireductor arenosus]MVA97888.1 outer membrane protein assembly factor BamA [Nitratireductor arenosus]